nr:MAG TPA: hypothetical protein [Caudoviricetes sp.]
MDNNYTYIKVLSIKNCSSFHCYIKIGTNSLSNFAKNF